MERIHLKESKQDHLTALVERYPRLFHGEPPRAHSEVPTEWAALIDKLCAEIDRLVVKESVWFQVNQIKEKFGTLRFYFSVGDPKTRTVGAPFGAGPSDKLEAAERLRDAVDILVWAAQTRTASMNTFGLPEYLLRAYTMIHPTIATWHHLVKTRNPAGLNDLLAEDAVFLSPIVHSPQAATASFDPIEVVLDRVERDFHTSECEQRLKPGLLEMLVRSQSSGDSPGPHDLKAGAVGHAPLFVGPRFE